MIILALNLSIWRNIREKPHNCPRCAFSSAESIALNVHIWECTHVISLTLLLSVRCVGETIWTYAYWWKALNVCSFRSFQVANTPSNGGWPLLPKIDGAPPIHLAGVCSLLVEHHPSWGIPLSTIDLKLGLGLKLWYLFCSISLFEATYNSAHWQEAWEAF